ncbi:PAAR domain-containing protein [Salmonella enterica]|nr:PAAR domain-containing protein [Salmonella enterica subsp. houtenae serovar 44:z36,[z38]:-]EHR3968245.1 PAAR domain-containing protein [Salmonella enterica subsp. houtenae serovar 44:z36,[z38]:-]EJK2021450.1 PAAR domain-containing protein [Salmonella enterica]
MGLKSVILKGDKTSHGGTVQEGFLSLTYANIPVSGIGHLVSCPKCEGIYPIVEGTKSATLNGVQVAVEGMKTACGAILIASQHELNAS